LKVNSEPDEILVREIPTLRKRKVGQAAENADLRGGNGDAVAGDDLLLVGEDLAGAGIDEHLKPLHIIVVVLGVIAEGFDAREIFETLSERIQKWLVYPKVMRIAMYIRNRLRECDYLVAKGDEEVMEAVELTVGLGECVGIAHRAATGVGRIEARVGLRDQHHCD
jgi:hypothetical protein